MQVCFLSTLQAMYRGTYVSPEPLRRLRKEGGYSTSLIIYTDYKSIFSAVSAEHIKTPSEKGTLYHAQWIRFLVDKRIIVLAWCDTRDMLSDGLTKGVVDRQALQAAMRGKWIMEHEALYYPAIPYKAKSL